MPKKTPSKKNDQPELPLDSAPAAPAGNDNATKAEESPAAPPVPAADSSPVTAPTDDPAPKRQPGEKVQNEQAPLAQAYRNWFLDYASYVILDRA
ncbi:MAG: DNA topoisomerase, partial [Chthoniobacteraceae bacterium]